MGLSAPRGRRARAPRWCPRFLLPLAGRSRAATLLSFLWVLSVLLVVLAAFLTGFLYVAARDAELDSLDHKFSQFAALRVSQLMEPFARRMEEIRFLGKVFDGADGPIRVNDFQFATAATWLMNKVGSSLTAIGLAVEVLDADRPAVEAELRAQFNLSSTYTFKEYNASANYTSVAAHAGTRPVYAALINIANYSSTLSTFGLDFYSEPRRKAALLAARARNVVSVVGPTTVVSRPFPQLGYGAYVPIYRARSFKDTPLPGEVVDLDLYPFKGYVITTLSITKILGEVLTSFDRSTHLSFFAEDVTAVDSPVVNEMRASSIETRGGVFFETPRLHALPYGRGVGVFRIIGDDPSGVQVYNTTYVDAALIQRDVDALPRPLVRTYAAYFGDHVWSITIVATSSFVDANLASSSSLFIEVGVPTIVLGAVLAVFFTLFRHRVIKSEVERQRASVERIRAARKAHEITVNYACHELRNPLHVVSGTVSALAESLDFMAQGLLDLGATDDSFDTDESRRSDGGGGGGGARSQSGSLNHPRRDQLRGLQQDSLQIVDQARSDLVVVKHSADMMQRLVNDMLDLAQLKSGQLDILPRVVSPRALVLDLVKAHARFARVNLLWRVEREVPPIALVDPLRVTQVLSSGLMNACKFTPRGAIAVIASLEYHRPIEWTAADDNTHFKDVLDGIQDVAGEGGSLLDSDRDSTPTLAARSRDIHGIYRELESIAPRILRTVANPAHPMHEQRRRRNRLRSGSVPDPEATPGSHASIVSVRATPGASPAPPRPLPPAAREDASRTAPSAASATSPGGSIAALTSPVTPVTPAAVRASASPSAMATASGHEAGSSEAAHVPAEPRWADDEWDVEGPPDVTGRIVVSGDGLPRSARGTILLGGGDLGPVVSAAAGVIVPYIVFRVVDTGATVSQNTQAELFQPFLVREEGLETYRARKEAASAAAVAIAASASASNAAPASTASLSTASSVRSCCGNLRSAVGQGHEAMTDDAEGIAEQARWRHPIDYDDPARDGPARHVGFLPAGMASHLPLAAREAIAVEAAEHASQEPFTEYVHRVFRECHQDDPRGGLPSSAARGHAALSAADAVPLEERSGGGGASAWAAAGGTAVSPPSPTPPSSHAHVSGDRSSRTEPMAVRVPPMSSPGGRLTASNVIPGLFANDTDEGVIRPRPTVRGFAHAPTPEPTPEVISEVPESEQGEGESSADLPRGRDPSSPHVHRFSPLDSSILSTPHLGLSSVGVPRDTPQPSATDAAEVADMTASPEQSPAARRTVGAGALRDDAGATTVVNGPIFAEKVTVARRRRSAVELDRSSSDSSKSYRSRLQGSGLGLSFSRTLARTMGGDLSLRNTPYGLTLFEFSIPLRPTASTLQSLSDSDVRELWENTKSSAADLREEHRQTELHAARTARVRQRAIHEAQWTAREQSDPSAAPIVAEERRRFDEAWDEAIRALEHPDNCLGHCEVILQTMERHRVTVINPRTGRVEDAASHGIVSTGHVSGISLSTPSSGRVPSSPMVSRGFDRGTERGSEVEPPRSRHVFLSPPRAFEGAVGLSGAVVVTRPAPGAALPAHAIIESPFGGRGLVGAAEPALGDPAAISSAGEPRPPLFEIRAGGNDADVAEHGRPTVTTTTATLGVEDVTSPARPRGAGTGSATLTPLRWMESGPEVTAVDGASIELSMPSVEPSARGPPRPAEHLWLPRVVGTPLVNPSSGPQPPSSAAMSSLYSSGPSAASEAGPHSLLSIAPRRRVPRTRRIEPSPLTFRVLLVDDEESVRKLTGRMLVQLGCTPLLIEDGSLAEEALRSAGNLPGLDTGAVASDAGGGGVGGSGRDLGHPNAAPSSSSSSSSSSDSSATTSSASHGSAEASSALFDVVLMDIVMLHSDGADVTRRLVQALGLRTPVIAMTGNSSLRDRERYRTCGFWGLLGKPFTREKLEAKLRAAVEDKLPRDPELWGDS